MLPRREVGDQLAVSGEQGTVVGDPGPLAAEAQVVAGLLVGGDEQEDEEVDDVFVDDGVVLQGDGRQPHQGHEHGAGEAGDAGADAEDQGQTDEAEAGKEQALGIDQLNTAVAQLNELTQQNAANAEESASTSEELSSQAR